MQQRRSAGVIAMVLIAALASCATWAPREVPAPPAKVRTIVGPARVTFFSRDTVTLVHIVIATDSLFGQNPDVTTIRYAYPLREVSRIEERVKQPIRTMILGAGILAVLLVL